MGAVEIYWMLVMLATPPITSSFSSSSLAAGPFSSSLTAAGGPTSVGSPSSWAEDDDLDGVQQNLKAGISFPPSPPRRWSLLNTSPSKLNVTSRHIQTDIGNKEMKEFPTFVAKVARKKKWPKRPVSRYVLSNAAKAKCLTGLDEYDRITIWEHLGEARDSLQIIGKDYKSGDMRCMSTSCQFLLTLLILRRNYDYKEAGYMFGISADTISCVFKTWLIFMFKKFGHDEWRKRLFVRRQDTYFIFS